MTETKAANARGERLPIKARHAQNTPTEIVAPGCPLHARAPGGFVIFSVIFLFFTFGLIATGWYLKRPLFRARFRDFLERYMSERKINESWVGAMASMPAPAGNLARRSCRRRWPVAPCGTGARLDDSGNHSRARRIDRRHAIEGGSGRRKLTHIDLRLTWSKPKNHL
jgi:hypothetical protein